MNIDNLKLLSEVLADLPADRAHDMGAWAIERKDESCVTTACTAGHGALSRIPELDKHYGEDWSDYILRVYGIEWESRVWYFAFGADWHGDSPERARARIDHLLEHGDAPFRRDWHLWGEWPQ